MDLAQQIHKNTLNDVNRVITHITIDDRKDKEISLRQQVEKVQ